MRTVDPTGTPRRTAREPGGPCMVLGYDRSEGARHAASWATSELLKTSPVPVITVPLSASQGSGQKLPSGATG